MATLGDLVIRLLTTTSLGTSEKSFTITVGPAVSGGSYVF
jgi:hypothetical protein